MWTFDINRQILTEYWKHFIFNEGNQKKIKYFNREFFYRELLKMQQPIMH